MNNYLIRPSIYDIFFIKKPLIQSGYDYLIRLFLLPSQQDL